jgi:hypothetical protein
VSGNGIVKPGYDTTWNFDPIKSWVSSSTENCDAQRSDKGMKHIHEKIEADKAKCFRKDDQAILWFNDRIVVPKDAEVRQ